MSIQQQARPHRPTGRPVTRRRGRILVLSKANVGAMMSSPGIRALNIARVLARALPEAEVVLGVPGGSDLVPDAPFRVQGYRALSLPRLALGFDIIISQGFPPTMLPAFWGRRLVMDFFTNFMIEGLEYRKEHVTPAVRHAWLDTQRVYLNLQLTLADFVICANDRQRDAWLGMMSSLGLITGRVYDRDNSLQRLVSVAAYGVRPDGQPAAVGAGPRACPPADGQPAAVGAGPRACPPADGQPAAVGAGPRACPPADGQPATVGAGPRACPPADGQPAVLKGVFPGIGAGDTVILWNGGILKWYDPVTLIRAVGRIVPERPELRLLFLGTKYPVAGFDPGETINEAYAAARELGLLGTHVLFNDGWLPYDDSGRYMVEADIGVSTYYDNLETHFSYRTRLMDFLWAETPVICTGGDVIAELVERRGVGLTVPERDVDALEQALRRLLDDAEFARSCRANLRALKPELQWEQTLAALVEFCRRDLAQPAGAAIARGKLTRTPDVLVRTSRYLLARATERWQAARAARA